MTVAKSFLQPPTSAPYRSRIFREELLRDCSLRVLVCPWQFSYAILNSDQHLIFIQAIDIPAAQRDYHAEFCMRIILKHSLFGKTYREVSLRFYSSPYYWMPQNFFSKSQLLEVGKLLRIENPYGEVTLNNEVKPFILANFPADVFNLLKLRMPQAIAHHAFIYFLPHLTHLFSSQQQFLVIYFYSNAVDIISFENEQLKFCNHYSFHSVEEFDQQLDALITFLGFDAEVPVYAAGEISEKSVLLKSLKKRFNHAAFLKRNSEIILENDYPFPHHFFQNLLC